MNTNEEYSFVQLDEFEQNIQTVWQDLQVDNNFCDVTLVCGDQEIKTHKFVLSSSSAILANILKQNLKQQPFIYITGTEYKDLKNLINFIYQGEVKIAKEDIYSFQKLAEDLQIKGLIEGSGGDISSKLDFANLSPENSVKIRSPLNKKALLKRKRMAEKYTINGSEEKLSDSEYLGKNMKKIKKKVKNIELRQQKEQNNMSSTNIRESDSKKETYKSDIHIKEEKFEGLFNHLLDGLEGNEDGFNKKEMSPNTISESTTETLSDFNQSLVIAEEKKSFVCVKCDKPFRSAMGLYNHKRSVHEGVRYNCKKCEYTAKQPQHLKQHIESIHEGVRYSCDNCNHKATDKSNLRRHVMKCRK